jgi:hypothetical protein
MGFMFKKMYVYRFITHLTKFIYLGLKLEKDFYNIRKNKFNISKVPDIYDTIKYDLLHNKNILQFPHTEDLYVCSKALADIVVPQVNAIKLIIF